MGEGGLRRGEGRAWEEEGIGVREEPAVSRGQGLVGKWSREGRGYGEGGRGKDMHVSLKNLRTSLHILMIHQPNPRMFKSELPKPHGSVISNHPLSPPSWVMPRLQVILPKESKSMDSVFDEVIKRVYSP